MIIGSLYRLFLMLILYISSLSPSLSLVLICICAYIRSLASSIASVYFAASLFHLYSSASVVTLLLLRIPRLVVALSTFLLSKIHALFLTLYWTAVLFFDLPTRLLNQRITPWVLNLVVIAVVLLIFVPPCRLRMRCLSWSPREYGFIFLLTQARTLASRRRGARKPILFRSSITYVHCKEKLLSCRPSCLCQP